MKTSQGRIGYAIGLGLALLIGALAALGTWEVPRPVLAQGPDGQATYYVALSCVGMPTPCFTSVQAAVDAADAPDDVIKVATGLYTGVSAREGVTQVVYLSKTVTIQGGYTVTNWTTPDPAAYPTVLSALGQGRVVYITGDITPTLAGLRLAGGNATGLGGYIDPDTFKVYDGGGAVYAAYATPTITNCQIDSSGAQAGGGIALFQSPLRLYNSSVLTNQAGYGGGIALGGSDAIVDGNLIAGNEAGYGGGASAGRSAAQLTNNTIRANKAISSGGGIALIGNPAATVRGNLIAGNNARWGGGIVISSSAATVAGNTITANHADEVGGGVNLDHCNATLSGNLIQENDAGHGGGGFYLVADTAVITGNQILSNTTPRKGGGLYLNESAAQVVNNTVAGNSASGTGGDQAGGGGVYVRRSNGAVLRGNDIRANAALIYGGGLYVEESGVTVANNTIAANTLDAQDSWDGGGGGVYLSRSDATVLTGNTLEANVATGQDNTSGGAVYLQDSDAQVTANRIYSNTLNTSGLWSIFYGGGVYVDGNSAPTVSQNEILSNTATGTGTSDGCGGGVYLTFGAGGQIVSNTIAYNRSDVGGGIYLQTSAGVVQENQIVANEAQRHSGGMHVISGTNTIQRNAFLSNTAGTVGGGLGLEHAQDNWVGNNVFAANHAEESGALCNSGAAVAISYASPPLLHNTIVSNTGSAGLCFHGRSPDAVLPMTNTIIAHHDTGVYVQSGSANLESTLWYSNSTDWDGSGTMNNINPLTGDPAFVNPAAHDYHIGALSAALNAGAVSGVPDDIDGDPRPADTGYDVGADERPGVSLRIGKTATPMAVNPGGMIVYTVTISSAGSANASAVVLTDTLPIETRVQNVQPSQGTCAGSGWGATVTCDLGALDAGAQAVVTLTVETTTTLPALLPARLRNVAHTRASGTLTMTAEADVWLQDCHVRLNNDPTDYTTVQAAVDAATQPSDVVKVAGICVGVNTYGGLRQQVYLVKPLTIRGGYSTGDWNTSNPAANPTALDALGLGRVVYVSGAISPTLEGLTLQNGDATGLAGYTHPLGGWTQDAGGGVAIVNANATVTNCQVYSSTASYGGGVFASGGAAYIANTVLAGNSGYSGGGLYLANDSAMATGNVIVNNTANNGAGVYLNESAATLSDNRVTANTAGSGGGVYIYMGAPTLSNNEIVTNTGREDSGVYAAFDNAVITGNLIAYNATSAYDGGGLSHSFSHSTVTSNTIAHNVSKRDGGGAYFLYSEAQYTGNTFLNNSAARDGGGAYVNRDYSGGGPVNFIGNTFTGNSAIQYGGGLRISAGTNVISGNVMMSNTARYGGGACLESSGSQLVQAVGNTVMSNTATIDGGGFYLFGPRPYLRNNILRGNRANYNGGGLYVRYQSYESVINTVIADNWAGNDGGGVYVECASPQFLHTTLARNDSGNGQAVYLQSCYSGGWRYSHPVFTNTLMANSATGFYIASNNSAELNGVLWYSVMTHSNGIAITATHEITGDPAFDADGYHLTSASAALDSGIDGGVTEDVDGELRPMGFGFDIGADEYPASTLLLDKQASADVVDAGGTVTYTLVIASVAGGTVHNVVLTDTLDAMQQATLLTTTQGTCALTPGWGGGAVCALGDMAVGTRVTVTLTAQVAPTATLGAQAVNQATARGDEAGSTVQTAVYVQFCRARINDGTTTYPTIQAAVDAANVGDLIKVAGGVCLGATERAGERQQVYISKTVTLRGGYDTGDWTSYDFDAHPTTLDALGQGRVLYLKGSGVAPTVEGFRITGGAAEGDDGGGIYVDGAGGQLQQLHIYENQSDLNGGGVALSDSSARLAQNLIYSNTAWLYGGGLYVYRSHAAQVNDNQIFANACILGDGGGVYLSYSDTALRGNAIFSNTAEQDGGGVYSQRSHAAFTGDRIYGNVARRDGGGVYLSLTSIPRLTNVVVADNQAERNGSGLYNGGALPRILHATIARNRAYGGSRDGVGVYVAVGTSVQLTNTIIVSQTTGVFAAGGTAAMLDGVLWYSNTANTDGTGSVAATSVVTGDPAFDTDGYHLLSGSAAIDQGLNAGVTEDIDGQPRPMDLGYDLGADEYAGVGLAVVKAAPSLYVLYHQPLTYTIFITSAGVLDATGVALTDTLDGWQQVSAVTASQGVCTPTLGWGGGAVCTLGTLASGATARITLTAQISPNVTLGQAMVNTAALTANETANGTQTTVYAADCRARINDGAIEYTLLQDAVDAATPGDLIKVAGGTCVGINTQGGYRQVVYLNKQVTIRGGYNDDWTTSDPDGNPTFIDAQNGGRALYVTGGSSPTLENLRFTGGNAGTLGGAGWSGSGGGASVNAATPIFSNTHFLNNAGARGGGLFLQSSGARVIGSRFYSNTASARGGGLYAYQSAATFDANRFYANTAAIEGGGVYLNRSNVEFNANLVTSNTANSGAGVYVETTTGPRFYNTVIADNHGASGMHVYDSSPQLWHTTIARNVYTESTGIYLTNSSNAAMTNTILVSQSVGIEVTGGNTATLNGVLWFGNTSNTSGAVTVQNATTGDPAFAADGYHLTAASQAIDRGVDSGVGVDIDGDARPQNGKYDLGADEYVGAAPPPVANFSGTPFSGDRPLLVTFTDLSTGSITEWLWRFGDGATSTITNPTHTYTIAGVYTVSLRVSGPGGSDTLTRTAYITVTEPATPVSYTLTIARTGDGHGVLTPTVGVHEYLSGTTALVTATAQEDSDFEGWSGACSGASPTCTVLMNADKWLTATFALKPIEPVSYTLTIAQAGDGAGTLTPGVGAHEYLSGTTALVTATAQAGSAFEGWSGAATGTTNPASVVMDADKVLTATFRALTYTLTVDVVGQGAVTRVPSQTTYLYGDMVTVTATPDAGWYFGQWSGDASGTLTQTTVLMTANRWVTATFLSTPPAYYTLTMGLVGSGVITPAVGAHSYLSGAVVSLSASPAVGWQFAGWSGDLESDANPTSLLMNGQKAVTATFTLMPVSYTLTLATTGNGHGTLTPGVGAHEYLSGTTALITATAQEDSDFEGWSGACSGTAPTCAALMDADKAVTATFTLKAVNNAPIADAGADQQVKPGAHVTLDGSASSDPDNHLPLTYLWRQTGGLAVSFTPTLSRTTFIAPGTPTVLTFTLTVTDSLGLADPTPDTVVITVEPYTIYLPFVLRTR